MLVFTLNIVLLLLLFNNVDAFCSNQCSSAGQCVYDRDVSGICSCNQHWNASHAADCSKRSCPFGRAWVDHANAEDTAHNSAECSNKGTCDRTTGSCTCDTGFEGPACERLSCNNNCNENGRCISMRERALELSLTYTLWDADKIHGCVCDSGFSGYDCSKKNCELGLESTVAAVNEVQVLECTCQADCSGSFILRILDEEVRIFNDFSASVMQARIEKLTRINSISITFTGGTTVCDADGVESKIEFTHNPGDLDIISIASNNLASTGITPVLNIVQGGATSSLSGSIVTANGAGTAHFCSRKGSCDTSGHCTCKEASAGEGGTFSYSNGNNDNANAGTVNNCAFATIAPTNCFQGLNDQSVNEVCSGHGTCDLSTYSCTCATGYTGPACEFTNCPQGVAWFDDPVSSNSAHNLAECSNRGDCNYVTGECACQTGFSGSACEQMSCPASCSSHGSCFSIKNLALLSHTDFGELLAFGYGAVTSDATWDKDSIYGCYCDRDFTLGPFAKSFGKYTGHDCSKLSCSHGHNPSLLNKVNERQKLKCTASSGKFKLQFTTKTSPEINFDLKIAELQTKLDSLSVVSSQIVASFEDSNVDSSTTTICAASSPDTILLDFKLPGDAPMLSADVTELVGSIQIEESVKGTTSWRECAGQGICDRATGFCKCFDGHISGDGSYDGQTFGEAGDCSALSEFGTSQV